MISQLINIDQAAHFYPYNKKKDKEQQKNYSWRTHTLFEPSATVHERNKLIRIQSTINSDVVCA